MKVKKENHKRIKAILLSFIAVLGPVAPYLLLNANDWFGLVKALIAIVAVIICVWTYAYLEPKEEMVLALPQVPQPPQG